jgi:hypothetical protein
MSKIIVSFKPKEEEMYKHVKKQISDSVYIKQLILQDMKKSQADPEIKKQDSSSLFGF